MDAIEKAIRNAFDKGNAEDRAFREKVYRSAFAALDRALQANPGATVETAIKRRKAMQAKIAEIESEFLPAVSSADAGEENGVAAPAVDSPMKQASAASVPDIDAPLALRVGPSAEKLLVEGAPSPVSGTSPSADPSLVPDVRLESASAGTSGAAAVPSAEVVPDRDERRARRRRFPVGVVLGVLLLAAIGYGLWWALHTGVLHLPDGAATSRSQAVGDEAAPAGETAPLAPGGVDQERNWITVFTPADPTLVRAPADAKAEVMKDDTGTFLRIRAGASGTAVSFDVGQGILEQLAGRHAVFDIIARAEDGKDTQMSIDCNFGKLGDCGRKRYAVGHERNEYLFDVRLPDERPGAGGTIAINPDFDQQGRPVDIYEIRASVAE